MTKKGPSQITFFFCITDLAVNFFEINEYVGRFLRQRRSMRFHVQLIQQRQNREQRFRRCCLRSQHVKYQLVLQQG